MLSNAIESAQKKIESRNFQTRKNTLEFDDVMNTQRALIYEQRRQVLDGDDLRESMQKLDPHLHRRSCGFRRRPQRICNPGSLCRHVRPYLGLFLDKEDFSFTDQELEGMSTDTITTMLLTKPPRYTASAKKPSVPPSCGSWSVVVMLRVVDEYWMEHISAMDELRRGINLRAYAQGETHRRLQARRLRNVRAK